MAPLAFCESCLGVFESRAFRNFNETLVVSNCHETCIFCGRDAFVDSNPNILKSAILEVLQARSLQRENVKLVGNVLRDLATQKISTEKAEQEIERIAPGLGKKVTEIVAKHGRKIIPLLLTAMPLFFSYQMLEVAREANEISREANEISSKSVELSMEKAADKAITSEHLPLLSDQKPDQKKVRDPGPHRAVQKNRKIRRAEEAKKRRKRKRG